MSAFTIMPVNNQKTHGNIFPSTTYMPSHDLLWTYRMSLCTTSLLLSRHHRTTGGKTTSQLALPLWRAATHSQRVAQTAAAARPAGPQGFGVHYRVAPTCRAWCRPAAGTSTPSTCPTPQPGVLSLCCCCCVVAGAS